MGFVILAATAAGMVFMLAVLAHAVWRDDHPKNTTE